MKPDRFFKALFFGNYFYGICAVALCMEAALQQRYPISSLGFYLFLFAATTWYYTLAYITDKTDTSSNPRDNWFVTCRHFVYISQIVLFFTALILFVVFVFVYYQQLLTITTSQFLQLLMVPLVALLYYGISFKKGFNLRSIGWLKPFVIGFTWAGTVTVYPVLYYNITHQLPGGLTMAGWLLLFKNLMFVAVLCIMFDIKDYATDANRQLKTFVVKTGLRNTIFRILIPLCIAGLAGFLLFGYINHFSLQKIAINTVPFIAMIAVAYTLQRRHSILFYLIIIDGLMLLKAVCGSLAFIYF